MSAAAPVSAGVKSALALFLLLNLGLWGASSRVYARWEGVPPPPSLNGAAALTLGDVQFSHRFLALSLQNLGNVGRDIAPLKTYDYNRLGQWFALLNRLDPSSDHVPAIAAYYFGSTRVPYDVRVIVHYLGTIGQVPAGQKWRWLAHAAYLAQHRLNDTDLAFAYADKLAELYDSGIDMPQWARQMKVFILNNRGDHDAARKMMETMLVTDHTAAAEEVNMMKAFLIEQMGVPEDEVEALARLRGGNK